MAGPDLVIWHGTGDEGRAFLEAIGHNCTCEWNVAKTEKLRECDLHHRAVHDQRFADGMLFMRRKVDCLKREEGIA